MSELVNNLINIKNTDTVYRTRERRLVSFFNKYFSEELGRIQSSSVASTILTDAYYMHYALAPALISKNPNDFLNKVLEAKRKLMNTREFKGIRHLTTLNDQLSQFHALQFSRKFLEELRKQIEKQQKQQGQDPQQAQQTANQIIQQLLTAIGKGKQGNQQMQAIAQAMANAGMNSRQVFKAMLKAEQDAKKKTGMIASLSWGLEKGTLEEMLDLSNAIVQAHNAEQIIAFGNLLFSKIPKMTMKTKKKGKFGIEFAEYSNTSNPALAIVKDFYPKELFTAKLATHSLTRKLKQEIKEGAIYVLLDKSGSMQGTKTIWSRSVALALFKKAVREKRKFFLRFFDTNIYPVIKDKNTILRQLLSVRSDGGTYIHGAILSACYDLQKDKEIRSKTNTIILISDGISSINKYELKQALSKANAILVFVLIPPGSEETEDVKEISHEFFSAELTEEDAIRIVRGV